LTPVATHGHDSSVSDSQGLVRVAVAPDPVTAGMWQEALRRAGVPALLRNRDALSVAWGTPAAPFSCELLVSAANADAARLILDDIAVSEEA
jgi:hypothetical protein